MSDVRSFNLTYFNCLVRLVIDVPLSMRLISQSAQAGSEFEDNSFHLLRGNPKGMTYLGNLYEKGHGVEQDLAEAFSWYSKAAEK